MARFSTRFNFRNGHQGAFFAKKKNSKNQFKIHFRPFGAKKNFFLVKKFSRQKTENFRIFLQFYVLESISAHLACGRIS